jgi:hypothetical protein
MDKTIEIINGIASFIKKEIVNEWMNSESKSEEFKNGLKHSIKIIDNWIDVQRIIAETNTSKESNLYDKFKFLKEKGHIKVFDEITKDELYQLSIIENKADSLIGNLFNVDKTDVRKKRYKWDIKVF